jgi:hypothetical protein
MMLCIRSVIATVLSASFLKSIAFGMTVCPLTKNHFCKSIDLINYDYSNTNHCHSTSRASSCLKTSDNLNLFSNSNNNSTNIHPRFENQAPLVSYDNLDVITNVTSLSQFFVISQKLIHCHALNYISLPCADFYDESLNLFHIDLRDHYAPLAKDSNHALSKYKNITLERAHKISLHSNHKMYKVDKLIDARCHHAWLYNPYHRIGDCLIFILPTLYSYLQSNLFIYENHYFDMHSTIRLIVDESTESLCPRDEHIRYFNGRKKSYRNHDDDCFYSKLHNILYPQSLHKRHIHINFECIRMSQYPASYYSYKNMKNLDIVTKEYIYLLEQKNPFTPGSGFKNEKHPFIDYYIIGYRHFMLDNYCVFCDLKRYNSHLREALEQSNISMENSSDVSEENLHRNKSITSTYFSTQQDKVLIIRRSPKLPRSISPYQRYKVSLSHYLKKFNQVFSTNFKLIEYFGKKIIVLCLHKYMIAISFHRSILVMACHSNVYDIRDSIRL